MGVMEDLHFTEGPFELASCRREFPRSGKANAGKFGRDDDLLFVAKLVADTPNS